MKKYLAISSIVALILFIIGIVGVTVSALNGNIVSVNNEELKVGNIKVDNKGVYIGNKVIVGEEGIKIGNLINLDGNFLDSIDEDLFRGFDMEDEVEFDENNGREIELDVHNTKVIVKSGDNDKILIKQLYNDDEKYTIRESSNGIKIESNFESHVFSTGNGYGQIEIYLPENSKSQLEIDTTNALISIDDVTMSKLKIDTTNAKINISNLKCNNVEAETTNGKILVDYIYNTKSASLKTTNGSIEANDVYSKTVTLKTTNGRVEINNEKDKDYVIDELKVSTTNGSKTINAKYNKLND